MTSHSEQMESLKSNENYVVISSPDVCIELCLGSPHLLLVIDRVVEAFQRRFHRLTPTLSGFILEQICFIREPGIVVSVLGTSTMYLVNRHCLLRTVSTQGNCVGIERFLCDLVCVPVPDSARLARLQRDVRPVHHFVQHHLSSSKQFPVHASKL